MKCNDDFTEVTLTLVARSVGSGFPGFILRAENLKPMAMLVMQSNFFSDSCNFYIVNLRGVNQYILQYIK